MKNKAGVLILAVLCGWAFFKCTAVQAQPLIARISWGANPASENVGWYIIRWFDGMTSTWELLGESSGTLINGRLTWAGGFDPGREISVGTKVCINITAARGSDRSVPSDQACDTLEETNGVQSIGLSKPAGLQAEVEAE